MDFSLPPLLILHVIGIAVIVMGVLFLLGMAWGFRNRLTYILAFVVFLAMGLFILSVKTPGRISIREDGIVLRAALSRTQFIPLESIVRTEVVNIREGDWTPVRRKAGTSVGDIRTGRFTLKNGRPAFLVVQGSRAVLVETRKGDLYLFGIGDFQGLLSALRETCPPISDMID